MYVNAITHLTGYHLQLASACEHVCVCVCGLRSNLTVGTIRSGHRCVCVCNVPGIGVCMHLSSHHRSTTCSENRRPNVVRSRIATIPVADIGVRMLRDHAVGPIKSGHRPMNVVSSHNTWGTIYDGYRSARACVCACVCVHSVCLCVCVCVCVGGGEFHTSHGLRFVPGI